MLLLQICSRHVYLAAKHCACVFVCYCRDIQKVLREDREKLRQMQKNQPRFTEDQKRELIEVHPWMRRGGLPKAIDVKVCIAYITALLNITHFT